MTRILYQGRNQINAVLSNSIVRTPIAPSTEAAKVDKVHDEAMTLTRCHVGPQYSVAGLKDLIL